jgi:hypothetical protein
MTDLRKAAEEAAKVLAKALSINFNDKRDWYSYKHDVEYAANLLLQALQRPAKSYTNGEPQYAMEDPSTNEQAHTDHPMRHWDRTCPACVVQQKPVAWINKHEIPELKRGTEALYVVFEEEMVDSVPLYEAPPSKPWVSLTDEAISSLWSWSMTTDAEQTATTQQHAFARAIEAALRSKNT